MRRKLEPGQLDIPGVGLRTFKKCRGKTFYYGVTLPHRIEASWKLELFRRIGDGVWTNFEGGRLPVTEAIIYGLRFSARCQSDAPIGNLLRLLFRLQITMLHNDEEVANAPISFFPFGLLPAAAVREAPDMDQLNVGSLAGGNLPIPVWYRPGSALTGRLEGIEKVDLYGQIDLYVILDTVVIEPLR